MNVFKLKNTKTANSFLNDEVGAVTVDWVVLTAALVGIVVTIVSTIRAGIDDAATDIRNELTSALGN